MTPDQRIGELADVLGLVAAWRSLHGLTAHQAEVLLHLYASGAITAADACRVIGLTTASMTRIVARLEAAGWLLRIRDDADARRLILQPTKQLVRAIEELDEALAAAAARRDGDADARHGELDAC